MYGILFTELSHIEFKGCRVCQRKQNQFHPPPHAIRQAGESD